MSSVRLQNAVRLRIFLILVLSIGIRLLRPLTSVSVFKATQLLEINYLLYAIVLICTLIPNKAAWMLAILTVAGASVLGAACFLFCLIATIRCMNGSQNGCIQTAPTDITSIVLVGLSTFLDIYQTWTVYRILRMRSFTASSTQRIRILFAWAWPFAWLVNISLWSESTWLFWTIPHLMIDPTLIVLANSDDTIVLLVLMCVAIVTDIIALLQTSVSLARLGIMTSLALTGAGILMLWVPEEPKKRRTSEQPVDIPALPVTPSIVPNKTLTRRKKSDQTKILF